MTPPVGGLTALADNLIRTGEADCPAPIAAAGNGGKATRPDIDEAGR
ncbi:hypothetical protein [Amycolatopsis sp. NPDC003676]